jgi:hypothetical protein
VNALFLTLLLAVHPASADVPPPNRAQCDGKVAGEACQTEAGTAGACAASTCSRLDYSHGTPPGSVDYACTLCVEGGDVTVSSTPPTSGSGEAPASSATPPSPSPSPADEPRCGLATGAEASFGLTVLAMSALFGRRRRA